MKRKGEGTYVGVFVADLVGAECVVDKRGQALVEVRGAVQEAHILGRAEVFVRVDDGVGAVAGALQPAGAFAGGPRRDLRDRDQLVAVERRLHGHSVG